MRLGLKISIGIVVLILLGIFAASMILPRLNDRQVNGQIELSALDAPVRVVRDSNATPYIYAETLLDAIRAQGFVMGQDRLFQLEIAKRAATGRLAEVLGSGPQDAILDLDREARTIGFSRLAKRQLERLSPDSRDIVTAYVEGLNAYITTRSDTHPMEFGLAGFQAEPWTEADVLSFMFYMGWGSSANFDAELIAHQIIQAVGPETFEEIAPIAINPDDDPQLRESRAASLETPPRWTGPATPPLGWTETGWRQLGYGGSNNWAVTGQKAGQPAAIVTNDPHLDSRSLPGPWHPVAMITPEFRVVGVSTGHPGIVVGRNEHVAFGVTNAYADAVDVYVETIDPTNPDHYLEGPQSYPFETVTEVIRVKDETRDEVFREENLTIRTTHRGPVISDLSSWQVGDSVLTVRWASAEYMGSDLGLDAIMRATSVDDALDAINLVRTVSLNFVVGDTSGRIARRASGAAPIRLRGDGMTPFPVIDGEDNWAGPIPADEMPGSVDPESGWTGTANHMTAPADYPYVYTTFASPGYRYRRISELLTGASVTADEVWSAQYDTLNVFARDLAPAYIAAWTASDDPALQDLATLLADWDFHDREDSLATTIFQETTRHLSLMTYEDQLGLEMTDLYLSNWYVWQERFGRMVQAGTSPWFDDISTEETEDLADLIQRAGLAAIDRLTNTYGSNRSKWQWGRVNQMRFTGPLRRDGFVGSLTGNRDLPMSGSGETLKRALYPFHTPFDTQWTASLRMTADLNDPDKVRAVLPGGVVGRTFHPNLNDQVKHWADETTETYWWFSDQAIAENERSSLTLTTGK
ncbi:MAG: penicillin acylase family protein [Pseudomonadota bacterium]